MKQRLNAIVSDYRLLLVVLVLATIAWIVSPLWWHSQVLAFRDAYHFYWPQSVWLNDSYQQGNWFPKWNPNEGLGAAVSAQPTWQIFYPLRVLWLPSWLSIETKYALYLAVHLILGSAGIYQSCRRIQVSCWGSSLACLAFPLSCPVLFQANNWVYLCSAAWIAWSMAPVVLLSSAPLRSYSAGRLVWLSCELLLLGALMTLSGDPQATVHLLIVLVLARIFYLVRGAAGILWRRKDIGWEQPWPPEFPRSGHSEFRIVMGRWFLLVATALALTLCLVQVWRALPWIKISDRSRLASQQVDSFHPQINAILADPQYQAQPRIYDFSLSPWNLPTLFAPTWSGHFFPEHSRWTQAIASESRMWVPSLYAGIITLGLAVWAVLFGRKDRLVSFLAFLLLVALLCAMGNFSWAWILRTILNWVSLESWAESLPTDSSGSFYGMLVSLLPGYSEFRYPAKWTVWMTATLVMLSAKGLDLVFKSRQQLELYGRMSLVLAIMFLFGAASLKLLLKYEVWRIRIAEWLQSSTDSMLGTPSFEASLKSVELSLLLPAAASLGLWSAITLAGRRIKLQESKQFQAKFWYGCFLGLTLFELLVLVPRWIVTTSTKFDSDLSGVAESVVAFPASSSSRTLLWANMGAAGLQNVASEMQSAMDHKLALQRQVLLGKLTHLAGVAALHCSGSIEPRAVVAIRRWLQTRDNLQLYQPELDTVLGQLGVAARLFRDQHGQLRWHSIQTTRPLCELLDDQGQTVQVDRLTWKFLGSDCLSIQVQVPEECWLLVRQLNDGGWYLESLPAEFNTYESSSAELESAETVQTSSQSSSQFAVSPNELWVTARLHGGSYHLFLRRWR